MHLLSGALVKTSANVVKESEFSQQNNSGEKRWIIFYISFTAEETVLAGWLTFKVLSSYSGSLLYGIKLDCLMVFQDNNYRGHE